MPETTLRAVIFDLDDTLIDWSGFQSDWATMELRHMQGVVDFIAAQGYPPIEVQVFSNAFRERTTAAWLAARDTLIAPHLGAVLVATAEALGVPAGALDQRRTLEAYAWGAVKGTVPFPEVEAVMQTLHAAGLKVGIITNAYQPMWQRDVEMETHGLLDFFPDCRISAADFGYLKPHPSIFQASLDCLGVRADEAVFVGDDPEADIVGAKGIGMKAVLRLTTRRMPSGDIIPDAAIRSLHDLLPLLDAWFPGWNKAAEAL